MSEPATMSISEAAQVLGVSRSVLYDLACTGEIAPGVPVRKIGRRLMVSRRRLMEWIEGDAA